MSNQNQNQTQSSTLGTVAKWTVGLALVAGAGYALYKWSENSLTSEELDDINEAINSVIDK